MKDNVVIIGNIGKDSVFEKAVESCEDAFTESGEDIIRAETPEEGKKRCMDILEGLAGRPLGENRKELHDKKNDAHFKAKDRW